MCMCVHMYAYLFIYIYRERTMTKMATHSLQGVWGAPAGTWVLADPSAFPHGLAGRGKKLLLPFHFPSRNTTSSMPAPAPSQSSDSFIITIILRLTPPAWLPHRHSLVMEQRIKTQPKGGKINKEASPRNIYAEGWHLGLGDLEMEYPVYDVRIGCM